MGTLVIGVVVFGAIGFAAYRVLQDHKKGKCCGCAHANSCSQKEHCS